MILTEGLLLLGKTGRTQAEIASEIGISESMVSHWFRRSRVPSKPHRALLKRVYAIDTKAWDRPAPEKKNGAIEVPKAPAEFFEMTTLETAAHLRRSAQEILWRATHAESDTMRARMTKEATAILLKVGQLTGEGRQLTHLQIVRSPAWQAIETEIVKALEAYPEAAASVGEVLIKLGKG